MRVIAGSARHLPLKTVKGAGTRPTTDRIKETLFNMIQNELYEINFLDLFAGSGGIGIEALSRGAQQSVFVEQDREAVSCIRENLAFTKLEEKGQVMACDVMTALTRLEQTGQVFHVIFMDPPYLLELEKRVLEYLASSRLCDEDTLIIAEASKDTDFTYLDALGYEMIKQKQYKTNQHVLIAKKEYKP